MNRKHAIAYMQAAGFENDRRTWTRLYTENRVSYTVATEAWSIGVTARKHYPEPGAVCICPQCVAYRTKP